MKVTLSIRWSTSCGKRARSFFNFWAMHLWQVKKNVQTLEKFSASLSSLFLWRGRVLHYFKFCGAFWKYKGERTGYEGRRVIRVFIWHQSVVYQTAPCVVAPTLVNTRVRSRALTYQNKQKIKRTFSWFLFRAEDGSTSRSTAHKLLAFIFIFCSLRRERFRVNERGRVETSTERERVIEKRRHFLLCKRCSF